MLKYISSKHEKNYRKRQQEKRSRNWESKKTRMSDAERPWSRWKRIKVEASRRQGEQVLDTNVPNTSTVQFNANGISDNIIISLSSDRIQSMEVNNEPQPSTST